VLVRQPLVHSLVHQHRSVTLLLLLLLLVVVVLVVVATVTGGPR